MRTRSSALGAALLTLLAPALTLAQTPCGSDLQAVLDQGVELRRQERPAEALAAFECARALGGGAKALAQVALAEKALGRWLPAREHLEEALALAQDPYVQSIRSVLTQQLAEVQTHLAALQVLGTPASAEVRVAGQVRGRLPLPAPLWLLPEAVTLEVRAPGYTTSERQLNLQAGRLLRETVELQPRALLSLTQRRRLGWISAGAAALGLALGIAAQITREVLITRYNDDAQCLDPQSLGQTRDQSCPDLRPIASTAQTAATVGWVSGGALAIAAVSLLVPTYRERRLTLVPSTGAGLAGLTLGGSL